MASFHHDEVCKLFLFSVIDYILSHVITPTLPSYEIHTDAQLCLGIQDLLDNANIADPAQIEAYQMYRYVKPLPIKSCVWNNRTLLTRRNDRPQYEKKIKAQAAERRPQ